MSAVPKTVSNRHNFCNIYDGMSDIFTLAAKMFVASLTDML